MYDTFNKLTPQRKNEIIQICIEEFAAKGYRGASTNHITQRAGISKGILFHYFGSKKNLYLYVVNHIATHFIQMLEENIKRVDQEDFFERIKEIILIKLKTFLPYPIEYRLLMKAFSEPPGELKKEKQEMYFRVYRSLNVLNTAFYSRHMDPSKLRSNINIEHAVELINIIFDQLFQKYLKRYRGKQGILEDSQQLIQDLDSYIEVLKYGVYSRGEGY